MPSSSSQLPEMKNLNLKDYILDLSADPENFAYHKVQESMTWFHEEFEFDKDKQDYENEETPEGIKRFLRLVIGFILVGDGLIAEDLVPLISRAIERKEWGLAFGLIKQLDMENTHALTYRKALSIFPVDEHEFILNSVNELEGTKKKGQWLHDNIETQESEGLRYIAMAAGEGIFFVFLFSMIFFIRSYFGNKSLFKSFIESNEQISKDETLHRTHKAFMAKRLLREDEREKALEIVKQAVEIEKENATFVLSEPVITKQTDGDWGLTVENLHKFIEKLADDLLYLAGLGKHYHSEVDLKWMVDVNLSQKSNFYEREVIGSYRATQGLMSAEEEDDGVDPISDPNLVEF